MYVRMRVGDADGIMRGGGGNRKGTVELNLPKPPRGGYYSCVITEEGMMDFYTKYCEVSQDGARKINLALVPIMKPGVF